MDLFTEHFPTSVSKRMSTITTVGKSLFFNFTAKYEVVKKKVLQFKSFYLLIFWNQTLKWGMLKILFSHLVCCGSVSVSNSKLFHQSVFLSDQYHCLSILPHIRRWITINNARYHSFLSNSAVDPGLVHFYLWSICGTKTRAIVHRGSICIHYKCHTLTFLNFNQK